MLFELLSHLIQTIPKAVAVECPMMSFYQELYVDEEMIFELVPVATKCLNYRLNVIKFAKTGVVDLNNLRAI
jgi:hypothetical protein